MTQPVLPPEPEAITRLRGALAAHDDWPTKDTKDAVVDAARNVIITVDEERARVQHLLQQQLDQSFVDAFKTSGVTVDPNIEEDTPASFRGFDFGSPRDF